MNEPQTSGEARSPRATALRVRAQGPRHFVLHTLPNAEQRVADALRHRGYAVYYPRVKKRIVHARRVDWAYRPFLEQYMFVRDDGVGISEIKRMNGVHDFIRAGLDPVHVRDGVLAAIRAREVDRFVCLDSEPTFEPGDDVKIKEGQFTGYGAVFGFNCGKKRAMVFLNTTLGRAKLEVDVRDLEAA